MTAAADTPTRRVWVLLAHDAATGLATRPVGAAGVDGERWHLSWVPLEPAAADWRERLRPADGLAPMPVRLAWWAEHTGGITAGMAALDPPPDAADLVGAVEQAVDALLGSGPGW